MLNTSTHRYFSRLLLDKFALRHVSCHLLDHFVFGHVSRSAGGETRNLIEHGLHVVPDLIGQLVVNQEQTLHKIIMTDGRQIIRTMINASMQEQIYRQTMLQTRADISRSVELII